MVEVELSLVHVFGVGSVASLLAFLVLGGLQVVRELLGSVSLSFLGRFVTLLCDSFSTSRWQRSLI